MLRRCGRKGHVAAWVADDTVAHDLIGTDDLGGPLLRCLRCGTFVSVDPASAVTTVVGTATAPVPVADVPLVLRGAHGRKLALLRLLSIERVVRGFLLLALGIMVCAAGAHHDSVVAKVDEVIAAATPLAREVGWDIQQSHLVATFQELVGSSATAYTVVGIGLMVYAVVQFVEGFGLWHAFRWAEYLAAIATAAFLPLEVWEVVHSPTPWKAATIAFNVVIVIWLIVKGRLFGVRGGHHGYLREVRDATLLGDILRAADRSPQEQGSTVEV